MKPSNEAALHIVFVPYMAPGHMMPMVDMARLFATHGVKSTIITTPANAELFRNSIDDDIKSGMQIAIEIVPFPHVETGLPKGCENLSSTPTLEMTLKLFDGVSLLQPKMEELIRALHPDSIASDIFYPWTVDLAKELGIPRLSFNGSGFFNNSVAYCIETYEPHRSVQSETEPFILPTLPDPIKITRSQLPDIVKEKNEFSVLFEKVKDAERRSFGMLVNSFYTLEACYVDYYGKHMGMKAWDLGPAFLWNNNNNKLDVTEKHSCIEWLDTKEPNSVLYVCFGSLAQFNKNQVTEIASALEDSGHNFIWALSKITGEQGWWLPEGYEERMHDDNKGLIIKGWAPQVSILGHPAVGGFLTHCGWNSILEGVSAGVPMLTWPIFSEQFYNEKLITQVLHTGVAVGNAQWKIWAMQDTELISRGMIQKAVTVIMDQGPEAEDMRRRATGIAQLAEKAVEQDGSSYKALMDLFKDIKSFRQL